MARQHRTTVPLAHPLQYLGTSYGRCGSMSRALNALRRDRQRVDDAGTIDRSAGA